MPTVLLSHVGPIMINRFRFVVAVLVVNNVTACFAAFGNCLLYYNPLFANTISCATRECAEWPSDDVCKAANPPMCKGIMQVIAKRSQCDNLNSNPCTDIPYWFRVQRPPVVDFTGTDCIGYTATTGWATYLSSYNTVYFSCVPGPPVYYPGGGQCE